MGVGLNRWGEPHWGWGGPQQVGWATTGDGGLDLLRWGGVHPQMG